MQTLFPSQGVVEVHGSASRDQKNRVGSPIRQRFENVIRHSHFRSPRQNERMHSIM